MQRPQAMHRPTAPRDLPDLYRHHHAASRRALRLAPLLAFALLAAGPAAADLREEWVLPHDTDPNIDDWLEPHYVCFDAAAAPRGRLYVNFPGSNATPDFYTLLIQTAAAEGYHAIGLRYPNSWSVNFTLCADSPDPNCHAKARREILSGVNTSPLIDVTRPNSIENRLVMLLRYLHARHPAEGWDQFLDNDEPRWARIMVGGHSQGGGHAAFIAKYHVVARVLLFAGGPDFSRYYGTLAPWLWGHLSSARDYYGFVHEQDSSPTHITTWGIFGMDVYGPPRDVAVTPPPYAFTHQLLTTLPPPDPGQYHNCIVVDDYTPLDPYGVPLYRPVWQYMLTSPFPVGDLNCDGLASFDDINPFVLALADPPAYRAAYPGCDFMNADCNGDGSVDFDDINAFVGLLTAR